MSFKTHNNNEKQITNTTYSPISFPNPDGVNGGSRLNISYFNKLLQVSIQRKSGTNGEYATYDTENTVSVYVSVQKAKILYDMIQAMKSDPSMHNVCVELNKGLLMVSDGSEYGTSSPCISINTFDDGDNITSTIYETRNNIYSGGYNYDINSQQYSSKAFADLELEVFENVLLQYYNAGTYAFAATVMEAGMYKRNGIRETINAIAEKVGVSSNSNNGGYSNKSRFMNNDNKSSNGGMSGVPKDYEAATFDSIAGGAY